MRNRMMSARSSPCPCLIGLDLGTSAIKGVLADTCGSVLAEAGADTCLLQPRDGWVETDPEQHYRNEHAARAAKRGLQ